MNATVLTDNPAIHRADDESFDSHFSSSQTPKKSRRAQHSRNFIPIRTYTRTAIIMPVTLHLSKHPLSSVDTRYKATDSKRLLESSCKDVKNCGEIFQSSFAEPGSSNVPAEGFAAIDLSKSAVCSVHGNGFVNTALLAYSSHHHLVMRPDDVWITILSQFNLYVNANAEKVRHLFVEHKQVIDFGVKSVGTRDKVQFGKLAEQMGKLIQEKVTDPELCEWIIPDFSTTTDNDVIVSSVIMMATPKAYFSYEFNLLCGLPAVTLLGVKADWESLLVKAQKLPSYGDETTQWHSLLKPVLAAFVRSFDEPESARTKGFWESIAHHTGGGPTFLSGWITAFCFFDNRGRPLYLDKTPGNVRSVGREIIPGFELDEVGYHRVDTESRPCFRFGGVEYHPVDTTKIPPAYAEADVTLDDDSGEKLETVMVAGLVGMEITSSGIRVENHDSGKDDTVQPVAGWWLFEKKKRDEPEREIPTAALSEIIRDYHARIALDNEEAMREFKRKYPAKKTP